MSMLTTWEWTILVLQIVLSAVVLFVAVRSTRSVGSDDADADISCPTWVKGNVIGVDVTRDPARIHAVNSDADPIASTTITRQSTDRDSIAWNWAPARVGSTMDKASFDDDPVLTMVVHCTIVECHELAHWADIENGSLKEHCRDDHSADWNSYLVDNAIDPTLPDGNIEFNV